MARHNREAKGVDQHGELWFIGYQPDWLKQVKISRQLPDGRRRSSLTLFRNPARVAEADPGKSIRTRIASADGSVEIQVSVEDRDSAVSRIVLALDRKRGRKTEEIQFRIEGKLPLVRRGGGGASGAGR